MAVKKLSIIVCTRNREKNLNELMLGLEKQDIKAGELSEVIVVDNNSEDNTKTIVARHKACLNLKYFLEKKIGLSHARNRGIKESGSRYIAFIDDDAVPESNWLSKALIVIDNKMPAIFGGPIYPFYKNIKPDWFLDEYESRNHGRIPKFLTAGSLLWGSNIFIKKCIIKNVGLFNPALGMQGEKIGLGEETEWQLRAKKKGMKIWYDPELKVKHLVSASKTNISYQIIKSFKFGRVSRFIYKNLDKGFFYDSYFLAREVIKGIFIIIFLFFRNKRKYPFWQNGFISAVRPAAERAGRLFSYFIHL